MALTTDGFKITIYQWPGAWGPFKVGVRNGERVLTEEAFLDILGKELEGIEVELEVRDWTRQWWNLLLSGGWRAPVVMINETIASQGHALTDGLLDNIVTQVNAGCTDLTGNHVFGRNSCPYCILAKKTLDEAGVDYFYHEVDKNKQAMYEMHLRVKPIIGPARPVTVPQIWLAGKYIGGADAVARHFISP